MPELASALTIIGTGSTAAGVAATGMQVAGAYFTAAAYAYAAYSMYDGQKQARRAQDAARASITDRLVTTRSSAAPAKIIYGRTRVAGDTIAYITNHGPRRPYGLRRRNRPCTDEFFSPRLFPSCIPP